MNAQAVTQEEFIEAEVAVICVRLIVTGIIWCTAVGLLDRATASASDPYVANTRLALWLFLVEVLIGTYYVRYTAATSFPLFKRAAFVVAESCTQTWRVARYVAINLTLRWLFVTLLTALAIYFFGSGYLTRIAALAPSGAFFVAQLFGLSAVAGIPPIIRGTHIGSYAEAVSRAAGLVLAARIALVQRLRDQGFDPSELCNVQILTIPFGGVLLPAVTPDPHYLFLGTTSSGKSLCIRMLLAPWLMPFGELKHRCLLYDGKGEFYAIFLGMGIPARLIRILNTGDARCCAWLLALDIRTRDDAMNIVHLLIPDDKSANDNPFFLDALRSIVVETIMVLHGITPGKWRFIDLLNALRTPELIKRVLATTKEGQESSLRYFTEAKETVGGLISTIDARFISKYETIARIWARCTRSFSLKEWIQERSILLLGYDANRSALDRINQAIFQRAAQLICALPEAGEKNQDHTWVVLDEVRFTGKLPMLNELISFGRTKNCHVVLAPSDLDGLIDVYGENKANEMLSLCGNVGILRLSSPKTRAWAATYFGEYEAFETDTSHSVTEGSSSSSSAQGGSSSRSWSETWGTTTRKVKRESILPSEFLNLPLTNRENGMHGFFATPVMGAWRAEIPTAFIDEHLPPSDPEARSFIPRSDSAVDPVPWSPEEERKYTRPAGDAKTKPTNDKKGEDGETGDSDSINDTQKKKKKQNGEGSDPLPNW